MADELRGIFPALVTPMTATEEIDLSALATHVDRLIEAGGVHGVIPLGSTGEYYALSPRERQAVVQTTVEAAGGRVPVVVGANAASTREVLHFARQAEQSGAAGVLLAAPYYSLPSCHELFEHFRTVDQAINIPIMLYNYPGRTGVDMVPDLIERLAELENVRYVKESSGDVTRISEIIRRCGQRLKVFCGCDTLALECFVLGAAGWVGGGSNFLPRSHVRLYAAAVEREDFLAARKLHYQLLPVLGILEQGKYTQLVKAGCGLMGHPVGPPRRPLLPPAPDEIAKLQAAINRVEEA